MRANTVENFWSRFRYVDGCLVWTGRTCRGYGQFDIDNQVVYAHRYAYELRHGKIPVGLDVLHTCDNPACAEDAHLYLGTASDNGRDMKDRNRVMFGERHFRAKLTNDAVAAIKQRYIPYSQGPNGSKALAEEFGVHPVTIHYVVSGYTWTRVAANV